MSAYRQFQQELQRLHDDQQTERRAAKAAALETIRRWIADYDLTAEELGIDLPKTAKRKAPRVP